MTLIRPRHADTPIHPDHLTGDALVGRTQGDALQLAELVRDHGPEVLNRLIDRWGPEHTRRVTIALAAAVNPYGRTKQLWGWLDPSPVVMSTSVHEHTLWKHAS